MWESEEEFSTSETLAGPEKTVNQPYMIHDIHRRVKGFCAFPGGAAGKPGGGVNDNEDRIAAVPVRFPRRPWHGIRSAPHWTRTRELRTTPSW